VISDERITWKLDIEMIETKAFKKVLSTPYVSVYAPTLN
jgi:hypothetical protein